MLNWMRVDSDVRRVGRFVLFQEGSFQSEINSLMPKITANSTYKTTQRINCLFQKRFRFHQRLQSMKRFPELGFLILTQAKTTQLWKPKDTCVRSHNRQRWSNFLIKKKKRQFMRESLNGYLGSYILQKEPLKFVHRIANLGAVYCGAQNIGCWLAATSREKRKFTH